MENHHFSWENPLFLWPFSIAMLVYQRVITYILKKKGPYSSSAQPPSAQSPQHPATRAPAPREAAPRGGTAMEEKVWKK